MSHFYETFTTPKPILGMLHLAGEGRRAKCDQAEEEARIMAGEGVDGVIVENYFGDGDDVERVIERLLDLNLGIKIGVNVLRDHARAFALAKNHSLSFLQIDSVAGHLAPQDDRPYAMELAAQRAHLAIPILGGVRFKYQPVLSGLSEEEDVRIGATRCDGLVVTSQATGQPTDLDKIRRFRAATNGTMPLLIGAGLTAASAPLQLNEADGAIVGSWFKHNHQDHGYVDSAHVARLMRVVDRIRNMR